MPSVKDLRKSGPQTLRKSGPYANICCIGQKHLNDKLEVADCKYDNNFSALQFFSNCSLNQTFLVWKLRIFIFAQHFAVWKTQGCWKYHNTFSNIQPKIHKEGIFGPKIVFLVLHKFSISAKFRVLIPNITIVFPNP